MLFLLVIMIVSLFLISSFLTDEGFKNETKKKSVILVCNVSMLTHESIHPPFLYICHANRLKPFTRNLFLICKAALWRLFLANKDFLLRNFWPWVSTNHEKYFWVQGQSKACISLLCRASLKLLPSTGLFFWVFCFTLTRNDLRVKGFYLWFWINCALQKLRICDL